MPQLCLFSLVQLILGVPLEIVHGPLRIGLIYLSGVLSGGLLTSISGRVAHFPIAKLEMKIQGEFLFLTKFDKVDQKSSELG